MVEDGNELEVWLALADALSLSDVLLLNEAGVDEGKELEPADALWLDDTEIVSLWLEDNKVEDGNELELWLSLDEAL